MPKVKKVYKAATAAAKGAMEDAKAKAVGVFAGAKSYAGFDLGERDCDLASEVNEEEAPGEACGCWRMTLTVLTRVERKKCFLLCCVLAMGAYSSYYTWYVLFPPRSFAPLGLGFRVPFVIVSPWTRGNIVVSEVFDHTSIIQFIEKKFNIHNPNLSPWRRAMVGDLLSAFDFENPPDYSWPDLPDTSEYVSQGNVACSELPPVQIPKTQTMPKQEPGTRKSKALPYTFLVSDKGVASTSSKQLSFSFSLANTGAAGAPFVLFDVLNLDSATPRNYAVEGGKALDDVVTIPTDSSGEFSLVLMGPNGFVREFAGSFGCSSAGLKMALTYDVKAGDVIVVVDATDVLLEESTAVGIVDNAYGSLPAPLLINVKSGTVSETRVHVGEVGNWYDLTAGVLPVDDSALTEADVLRALDKKDDGEAEVKRKRGARNVATRSTGNDSCFVRRFLGRMETGEDTISDPAMGSGVKGMWEKSQTHPELSDKVRALKRVAPTNSRPPPHKDAAVDKGL